MPQIQIGDIAVSTVVEDRRTLFDAARFFPKSTPQDYAAEMDWLLPDLFDRNSNSLICTVQSYVFKAPDGRNVLIDTCVGNDKQGRTRPSWNNGKWPWIENLSKAGFEPEDIDVVLCTHLHFDHAGWNTRLVNGQWVPTFPNAEYLASKTEMEHLRSNVSAGKPLDSHVFVDSVLPTINSGQSILVEMDHKISDGVRLQPSPGHTPGHVSVWIESNGDAGVAIGDVMHHPIQALHPEWSSLPCVDPERAVDTRRQLLENVCDTSTWLLPAHFDPCRVMRRNNAFWFNFN